MKLKLGRAAGLTYSGRQQRGKQRGCTPQRRELRLSVCRAQAEAVETDTDEAEPAKLQPVEKIVSVKIFFEDDGKPSVRYLAKWKVRGCADAHRAVAKYFTGSARLATLLASCVCEQGWQWIEVMEWY